MPKTESKPRQRKSKPAATDKSKVEYPELETRICVGPDAITAEQMKALMGWEEVKTKDDACVPELLSLLGKHVRLTKNAANRYLTMGDLLDLKQEFLTRRFAPKGPNGDAIVIGRHGNFMSGQHRGLGLILADIEYHSEGERGEHWRSISDKPPVMETFVNYGVDESDETFRTLNTGKPATFVEVMYRSNYFADQKPTDRKAMSRILDYAVRMLWHRTAAKVDSYAPRRTHGETAEFIERHGAKGGKLVQAVKHIHACEADKKQLTGVIGNVLGGAAGLLYLMGCSGSDYDAYYPDDRNESVLDWSDWDKACDFFTLLAGSGPDAKAVIDYLGSLHNHPGGRKRTSDEVFAVLVKAFLAFAEKGSIKPADVRLKWENEYDEQGVVIGRTMDGPPPLLGGIDRGGPKEDDTPPPPVTPDDEVDPSADEVESGDAGDDEGGEEEEDPVTEETVKSAKEEIRNGHKSWREQLEELKGTYPDVLLLFTGKKGASAWAGDATRVAQATGSETEEKDGLDHVLITSAELGAVVKKLLKKGKVAYVEPGANGEPPVVKMLDSAGRPITKAVRDS